LEYFTDDSVGINEDIIFDTYLDRFDIPFILDQEMEVPKFLGEYTNNKIDDWSDGAMHFYLDDARFNAVWSNPIKAFERMKRFGVNTILTPDFSTYTDYPQVMQMWNVYRNRVCGAYWQHLGMNVIPTIGWSDEFSYDYSFLGVPQGSIVSVSTVGMMRVNSKEINNLWLQGYKEMIRVIQPRLVLCYGNLDKRYLDLAPTIIYPTRWHGIANKTVARGRAVAKGLFDYDDSIK